jgi:hypothetical protein
MAKNKFGKIGNFNFSGNLQQRKFLSNPLNRLGIQKFLAEKFKFALSKPLLTNKKPAQKCTGFLFFYNQWQCLKAL